MSTTGKSWVQFPLRFLLGLLLVVAIIWLTGVNPHDIWRTINQVNIHRLLAILVPIMLLDRLLMSYKWNLLLRAAGIHVTLWDNFKLYMTSGFVGLALPSTVGADLVRSYQLYLKRFDPSEVVTSIFLERFLGFLAVATLALVTAPVLAWQYPALWPAVFIVTTMIVTICSAVLLMFNVRVARLIKRLLPRIIGHRLTTLAERVYGSFRAYRSRGRVLAIFFGLSLVETAMPILVIGILARLLGIEVPWVTFTMIVPITLFITRVPITLNAIGVIEWSFVYFFAAVGVSHAEALSLGLLTDVLGLLFGLSGGLILLFDIATNAYTRSQGRGARPRT